MAMIEFHGYCLRFGRPLLMVMLLAVHEVLGLTLREVYVPAVVMRGDPVRLNCSYDLEGDKLYSIKWHKNNVEFYRYLPDNKPAGQRYDLEGIYLDLRKCKEGFISMYQTSVSSEGIYRCEVSTDAPSFQMVKGEGEMRIYVIPSEEPEIYGNKRSYVLQDEANLTCLAAPSRPAAFLKWFMNGKEVPNEYLVKSDPKETNEGLLTSSLGLKFTVEPRHYVEDENGKTMRLHCEAIISQAHALTSEEIIISSNATEPRDTKSFSTSVYDGPSITGGRIRYQVGDFVHLNCTASRSQPPAELHWYLNDKEVRHDSIIHHNPVRYADGQESTVLGLKFIVKNRHFLKGQMRLRCTAAALSEVKRMSSQIVEINNRKQETSGFHYAENPRTVLNTASNQKLHTYSLLALLFTAATKIFL